MYNFEPILKMADAIVIDRGYLGAEVDVEIVCIAQKKMIALVCFFYVFIVVIYKTLTITNRPMRLGNRFLLLTKCSSK
jgi:pyruvate kinase